MSAAAVDVQDCDETVRARTPALLRQQVAEVLAAHRSRRQRPVVDQDAVVGSLDAGIGALPSRSQRIASRVTERYAQTPSYEALLAVEAEEATKRARAAAEVAARSAEAVAAAQRELLEELAAAEARAQEAVAAGAIERDLHETAEVVHEQSFPGRLTVRLFEDVREASRSLRPLEPSMRGAWREFESVDSDETRALDEEISFRQSPTFDLERSSVAIPGNLLEFPRQLVAARKARPRYALGPLGEDGLEVQEGAQLRIFEVGATEITSAPPAESAAAEWSSIWLEALIKDFPEEVAAQVVEGAPRVEAASLERRMMAALVDVCLIGLGVVIFATAFAYNVDVLPSLPVTGMYGAGVLVGMILLYQMLFFSLSEATPGMRYARIGLCTFSDENPRRSALLRRAGATLLAGCPLGLGFLWAWVDEDGLGWHDRMSGMYQRSY